MAYREPVQAGQNWRDVAVPRLLCNNSSKGVLNQLKASKIWCGCACKKRITVVKARADYCHGHRFCCFGGQGWTNVSQSPNMKIWCLTNRGNMLIERHIDALIDASYKKLFLIMRLCIWWHNAKASNRVMQLNWLCFCGICHMMPQKVWPNTALSCNHQSTYLNHNLYVQLLWYWHTTPMRWRLEWALCSDRAL